MSILKEKLHGDGRKRNMGHRLCWLLSLPLINQHAWMVHIGWETDGGGVGTNLIAAEGGGARLGRRMADSINHQLQNINGKCEGGDWRARGAWPATVIHAVGNYRVHGGVRKGKKGKAEELAGMMWRGKSTINQQLRGGGGGNHKSPARVEAEKCGAREER
jgi:hypothetical protein